MGLKDDERILAAIPMSHSYGLSSVAMPALLRRALLVVPELKSPLDPMRLTRDKGVTFLPTVPAYLRTLVAMASPPRAPASLRLVVTAGAPLKTQTAIRFREIYDRPVHVFYGASECGGITFDREGSAGERGTLGRPVAGVEVTLEPRPGAPAGGAVVVASAAVASGYHPQPDPRLRDGIFRTSDVGRWHEGELVLEGRLDDLINVRGKKVNPREVDAVVARLEGVDDVVTLGFARPGRDEIVRSFVACRPGRLSYETVQAWCRRHLAEHKVPRSIVLVAEIPRTARGKLDRAALLALEPHGRPIQSPDA
jgi:long-chain acyl-CoA synthetase